MRVHVPTDGTDNIIIRGPSFSLTLEHPVRAGLIVTSDCVRADKLQQNIIFANDGAAAVDRLSSRRATADPGINLPESQPP